MTVFTVCVEYPGGQRVEDVEAESYEEAEEIAKDIFFNICNYGISKKD